jgi:hypothetical protein
MASNLEKVIQKTAKIMLICVIFSLGASCVCPYQYAYKVNKKAQRDLEKQKKAERSSND